MRGALGASSRMPPTQKMPNRHFEGETSRNYTTYNFQVLRDDVFMLGRDGTVTGNRVAPAASRSAVLVSSQNQDRKSTRLNSSHANISYAVFCLKNKKT